MDLPITIEKEPVFVNLLKAFDLHIDENVFLNPYDIIYLMVRLHAILFPKKILCFSDVFNYLDENDLQNLQKESNLLKIKVILIN